MTTALEGGEGSASLPGRSLLRERPGTHCTGSWVGPRAGLDRCRKPRPKPRFDPRTVQPIASRYTNYATEGSILCPKIKFLTIILAIFPFLTISNSTLTFVLHTYVRSLPLKPSFQTTHRVPLLLENMHCRRF